MQRIQREGRIRFYILKIQDPSKVLGRCFQPLNAWRNPLLRIPGREELGASQLFNDVGKEWNLCKRLIMSKKAGG
jgi:hypothetical protein